MECLAEAMTKNHEDGKSADLLYAFQSYALDNVTTFCWDSSMNAIVAPNFSSPIIIALNTSVLGHQLFKNFAPIRKIKLGLPTWLATKSSPGMAGVRHLQKTSWKIV